LYRVVNEADVSRAIKVNDKQVEEAVVPLMQDLSEAEMAAIGSKEVRKKDLDVACSASVKYLGALNRLPTAIKARTLRIIYSND
jgi:N-methylhydantoinase A/oxoprolinase/acetone carboxylase beta subunit